MSPPLSLTLDLLRGGRLLLEEAIGAAAATRLEGEALRHLARLEPGAPRFHQRMNRRLFALGVPALAVYRALREDRGLPEDRALALVELLLERRTRDVMGKPVRRAILSTALRLPVLRERLAREITSLDEPEGFRMERVQGEGVLGFDVRECALHRYLSAQGAPELTRLICRLDDVMMDYVEGLALVRTGTLGRGDERCDFRYHRR